MYEQRKGRRGLTGNQLKILAVISMLIDHTGAIFYPQIMLMRIIGRLAFPIFAFLLVEGFYHTRDLRTYEKRIFIFAVASEFPFNLAFYNKLIYWDHQNIFFTLLLGLVLMDLLQNEKRYWCRILGTVGIYLFAFFGRTDYSIAGITFILIFYMFYTRVFEKLSLFALTDIISYGLSSVQSFAALAVIPIGLYNGKQGRSDKRMKYLFYFFYPVHLIVLYAIRSL